MPHDVLLTRVSGLIEAGQKLQIIIPQDTGFFSIDTARTDGIRGLTEEAVDVLQQVTDTFDGRGSIDQPRATLSPQELADLAFIGRAELLEIRTDLAQAIDSGNMWKIASQGDRATARTVRALIPIEATLRQYDQLEPIERRWFDLDDALQIRRHFVDLWLLGRRRPDDDGVSVRDRLRSVVEYIDRLRQAPIYPHMRIDDRLQIRSLQKRIRHALDQAVDADSTREAERLWQDSVGFFDLLMHISRREELRDHDRILVGKALREIRGSVPANQDRLRAELREKLLPLASQDPGLAALLLADGPAPLDAYLDPLESLRTSLAPGG